MHLLRGLAHIVRGACRDDAALWGTATTAPVTAQERWRSALPDAAVGATIDALLVLDDDTLEIHLSNGMVILARRWYAR